MDGRGGVVVVVAGLLAACAGGSQPGPRPSPVGPADVRVAAVEQHRRQFEEDIPRRPAGSQEEGAAAVYILGHLQRAGYLVRLEDVPVANLVSSSVVIALPPGGSDPSAVVAVPYDTSPGGSDDATAIGLWLEVARALRVVEPLHSVEFAGLGADSPAVGAGQLGSRRLAQLLRDQDVRPTIIVLGAIRSTGDVTISGDAAGELMVAARAAGVSTRVGPPSDDVFRAAGFPTAVISGGARPAGRLLLHFLAT